MSKGNVMTLEQKLYAMRMIDLAEYAEARGIKINKKGAKAKAVEKILAVENDKWEEEAKKEKEAQEKLQAEKDKVAEDAINKKEPKIEDPDPEEKPVPKRGALIEYNGKSQNICAWAKELGKSANTLYGRIYKLGWSVEKAFTK